MAYGITGRSFLLISLANLNSLYVVRPAVVCLSSVTFVHSTQAIEVFGNLSSPFGTLAIRWQPAKIFTDTVPGEPLRWGVERKRGSPI